MVILRNKPGTVMPPFFFISASVQGDLSAITSYITHPSAQMSLENE